MAISFSLEGKNAIVTGATRGIGLAIAQGFLDAGATVTLCGRKQEGLDAALGQLDGATDRAQGVVAHVGQSEDVERLMEGAKKRFGPVTVLVNNAGTNPYFGPIAQSEDWAWDKTMAVNLRAPYVLSRAVRSQMIEAGGGSIINMSSVAALESSPFMGIYSVTKAGLVMLTKVMAKEWGSHKIRVNCICPGVIKTKLSEGLWQDDKVAESFLARKALGRIGAPDEIVGATVYFASDASSFTTGAVLQIDGGMVI